MAPARTTRTVAEVMSAPAVIASSSETVAEASARMAAHGVGSVVVVDGGRPLGILTERDLVRFSAAGAAAADTKVSEWMTEPVDCVEPGVSVQDAFAQLQDHGYRHLPVVEDGAVLGIVSLRDLMVVAHIQPVVHPSTIEAPPGLEPAQQAQQRREARRHPAGVRAGLRRVDDHLRLGDRHHERQRPGPLADQPLGEAVGEDAADAAAEQRRQAQPQLHVR